MNLPIILQAANLIATDAAPKQMNLWEMAQYGGPIMIVLAIMLLIAVYIFIERFITIKQASKEDKNFINKIKDYISDNNVESAKQLCETLDTPASRMIAKGISRLGKPMNDVQVAVENVGNLEIAKLEKGMNILATVSGGAPMLGFLGTVTGMVQVFYSMTQNESGVVHLLDLSTGMYQAMVTTVGGLLVGILSYFAYNYLVSRIDSVVRGLETKTVEFMDLMVSPAKSK